MVLLGLFLHLCFVQAALGFWWGWGNGADAQNTAVDESTDWESSVKQVAIIGGGAAGSSAAYYLRKYASEAGIEVNVTLFEKRSHIGGRAVTVNVYDNPLEPVELGASIFVEVNQILYNATKEFGLNFVDPGTDEKGLLGIWNGDKFVYTQSSESWEWWNLAKLFWQYGMAPYHVRNVVKQTVATFLKLYQEPYFPFRSLTSRVFELDLVKLTSSTGVQFLEEKKLYGPFARDIVQTSTRVNYMSNLAYIHGFGTMVSMAAEGAVAVLGGNWQIFSKMVEKSDAYVYLNTSVTSIAKKTHKDPSRPPRYVVNTEKSGSVKSEVETQSVAFDDVIIATPYQYSGIHSEQDVIEHPVEPIPYATLYVTLFATPFGFSPEFFKLPPASKVPISVLTTLGEDEEPQPGAAGAGKAGFFSATLVKVVTNPKTNREEYVYKIFSPDKVTPEFLSSLLGVQIPKSFTGPIFLENENGTSTVEPISWYHPTMFHPYPQELPRVTFQDPILGEGLYYTSGIESFASTMETSALMGMNVAKLIINDYQGIPEEGVPDMPVDDDETLVGQKTVGVDEL